MSQERCYKISSERLSALNESPTFLIALDDAIVALSPGVAPSNLVEDLRCVGVFIEDQDVPTTFNSYNLILSKTSDSNEVIARKGEFIIDNSAIQIYPLRFRYTIYDLEKFLFHMDERRIVSNSCFLTSRSSWPDKLRHFADLTSIQAFNDVSVYHDLTSFPSDASANHGLLIKARNLEAQESKSIDVLILITRNCNNVSSLLKAAAERCYRNPRTAHYQLSSGLLLSSILSLSAISGKYDCGVKSLFTPYLMNVHELIDEKRVASRSRINAAVKRAYYYMHYMLDGFNDDGWGCAYRSLQTIVSFYILNDLLSDISIPSHKEVQQLLFDIGDKPKTFVGSKQWIGSFEVSYYLQSKLKLECRTLHVSNGGEMSGIARQLIDHFERVGTPVMIGGGVLAHTIIGVDFDDSAGEAKYLILDPHYTGADDVATIVAGGWVGWKNADFWSKKDFYNLCLPQLP